MKLKDILVLGTVAGAVAAGTYYYLKKQDAEFFEDEFDDLDDFDFEADEVEEEETERTYVTLREDETEPADAEDEEA